MARPQVTRTTVELDRGLLREAMEAGGHATMREAVESGLRELVNRRKRLAARDRHRGAHPDFEAPGDGQDRPAPSDLAPSSSE
jgi:Arc/MetJ family transcription regulator